MRVLGPWKAWPRLQVWNGILYRRFDLSDGTTTTWQAILPKQMRQEFLLRMIDGHLSRKRTAASIQARVYWPTWSSDMNVVWKERQSGVRNYGESAPYESTKNTPTNLFPGHEVSRSIEVEMGLSPGKKNAATSPHDILHEDVINACRLAHDLRDCELVLCKEKGITF